MIPDNPHPWVTRLFTAAALIGVTGWVILLGLFGWWMVQPVTMPSIAEPINVLNPGNRVAIGDPLVMRLVVNKPNPAEAVNSTRRLECPTSGNLVTLTAGSAVPLPVGAYTLVSDNVVMPAKVTPGDVCEAVWVVVYHINPIRDEVLEWRSEPFTVLPAQPQEAP
jgi:hypothetical protein